ncbi:iron chelate uptake ABC transporter family permease subunit [Amycolatopsis sp. GM8]|uniref:FecCD family ABC transporter permease n=1 Tax=Amycolatopsis sp. GM8 TaxID=2896530 RepID=UPI001F02EAD7|nr:iron chelate uptake ABC transporter family permease subunit [Amycolatopsis sp. GM8]
MTLESGRLPVRSIVYSVVTLAAALVIGFAALLTGSYHLSPGAVLDVLAGGGSGTDQFIVVGQRLPRITAALVVGGALGIAGALFQSVSRNPLGSPDIIGFTTGSASGALVSILVAGTGGLRTGIGAILGGIATAALVYVLAIVRGARGQRLIMAGIAVGAMLASLNDYLLTRADQNQAEVAKLWLFGSLNGITWPAALPLICALPVLLAGTLPLVRPLRLLELGDDKAATVGVRVGRTRFFALLLGVLLTAGAIATAGPIGFLALAAPQLTRRLTRSAGITVLPSALTGAALLCAADLAAQQVLAPFELPVGLVTGALGGIYLMWLLTTRQR